MWLAKHADDPERFPESCSTGTDAADTDAAAVAAPPLSEAAGEGVTCGSPHKDSSKVSGDATGLLAPSSVALLVPSPQPGALARGQTEQTATSSASNMSSHIGSPDLCANRPRVDPVALKKEVANTSQQAVGALSGNSAGCMQSATVPVVPN